MGDTARVVQSLREDTTRAAYKLATAFDQTRAQASVGRIDLATNGTKCTPEDKEEEDKDGKGLRELENDEDSRVRHGCNHRVFRSKR